jgi:hypothetical protein
MVPLRSQVNKRDREGLGFELAQLVFADPNPLERIDRRTSFGGRSTAITLGKH